MRYSLIPVIALAVMAACDDDPIGTQQTARVRIVNAANTNATVSAFRGSAQLGADVAFQAASACNTITVPTGQHVISFRNPGSATQVASVQHTFVANRDYLVVLMAAPLRAAVFEEQPLPTPAAGNNAIRLINATATAGDVYVTTPTGTPTTAINIASGESSTGAVYREFPIAATLARIFNTGETNFTTPRASHTLGATGTTRTATVILTPTATGGTVSGFQVPRC
jgi:hypothetical protein